MKIRVIELFAGVGGFRVGLEGYPKAMDTPYEVIWSNQWEPSTKTQHANLVYKNRWPESDHCGTNLEQIVEEQFELIPDHDLLVGGFPCQDYSVATTLKNSKGLMGKKGVLWWSIEAILRKKKNKPKYLLLENVDRLLKSPSNQRGRDFAVMLASLNELGYAVEWRVINAAEYGMPQRRRRIFFLAYHNTTELYFKLNKIEKLNWIDKEGVMAKAFPVGNVVMSPHEFGIEGDLVHISADFNKNGTDSPFENTGVMIDGKVTTQKTFPSFDGEFTVLKDILENGSVPDEFFIKDEDYSRWEYLKGGKKEVRITKNGYQYNYSEGGMIFPDALDKASRTIITGEGGRSPSRFKHVVQTKKGLRRLTPLELERLNMFPDDHTKLDGISDTKRAFFMGNALVVGIIEKIGHQLAKEVANDV